MEASSLAPAPADNSESVVPILELLAARAAQLYSLPAVAAQVLELTGSGDVDRVALKACLENDPALTTRILKVVNSSLFGVTRKVTDLGQALALLGVKPLKMLVLGFSLPVELLAHTEKDVLTKYWRHTLLKAAGCREITRRLYPAQSEEVFTAGLLQDIGELVLIQQLGTSYIRFRNQVLKEQRALRDAEWLALGFDHVELSSRLLRQWGMPESFTALIGSKPGSPQTVQENDPLVQVLQIAELMARVLESGGIDQIGLAATARDWLGLSALQVQEILGLLGARAGELAKILALDLPDRTDLATTAHERLVEASEQVLLERVSEESLLADLASLQTQMHAAARRQISPEQRSAKMHAPQTPRPLGHQSSAAQVVSPFASDSQLLSRVSAAIARCREQKASLCLVLFQVHKGLARGNDPESYPALAKLVTALERWSQYKDSGLVLSKNVIALLWEDCSRSDGFEIARHLLHLAQASSQGDDGSLASGWTLSAGLATVTLPPRNFPPHDLIAAAQRCLSAALQSGVGAVKSIEF